MALPTPAPGGTNVARATPIPVATPARSIDQIDTRGGRKADAPMERLSYEVAIKGGYSIPGDKAFAGAPSTGAEVRWSLGNGRTFAIGVEASAMGFGGTVPEDPNRASSPAAINVTLTPVMLHATYWLPFDGRVRPYLAAGPGFVYAQSSYQEYARSIDETKVGPAAEGLLGMQFDLSPSPFREGKQKLFVEVKSSYMVLDFAAHEYDTWAATSVLLGAEIKF